MPYLLIDGTDVTRWDIAPAAASQHDSALLYSILSHRWFYPKIMKFSFAPNQQTWTMVTESMVTNEHRLMVLLHT